MYFNVPESLMSSEAAPAIILKSPGSTTLLKSLSSNSRESCLMTNSTLRLSPRSRWILSNPASFFSYVVTQLRTSLMYSCTISSPAISPVFLTVRLTVTFCSGDVITSGVILKSEYS